jgi:hypothetical protein
MFNLTRRQRRPRLAPHAIGKEAGQVRADMDSHGWGDLQK